MIGKGSKSGCIRTLHSLKKSSMMLLVECIELMNYCLGAMRMSISFDLNISLIILLLL